MKKTIYTAIDNKPFFKARNVTFDGYRGMAMSQHTKNSELLHNIFEKTWHERRPLEISRASISELGKQLSAFNLVWHRNEGKEYTLEQIFQASKTFQNGGPFTDILDKKSNAAKKDPRFHESGSLKCFTFNGIVYPLEPKGSFYDWIYIQALMSNPDLAKQVADYDSFTDIFFNSDKQINCQAEACAMYVGLVKTNKLSEEMKSYDFFTKTIF